MAQEDKRFTNHWDRLPAELQIIILRFAGALTAYICNVSPAPQRRSHHPAHGHAANCHNHSGTHANHFHHKKDHSNNPKTADKSLSNSRTITVDPATARQIWRDAFVLDWPGNLSILPDTLLFFKTELIHVRSRSMYQRLCARFPDRASTQRFAAVDKSLNRYDYEDDEDSNSNSLHQLSPSHESVGSDHASHHHHGAQDQQDDESIGKYKNKQQSIRLYHIAMHHCWTDLIDYTYPISLGWAAIAQNHASFLKYLASPPDQNAYPTSDAHAQEHAQPRVELLRFRSIVHEDDMGCIGEDLAMDLAAKCGNIDILQLLQDAGSDACSEDAMDWAASWGFLDVVQWLHANRTEGCTVRAMNWAAEWNHLHVLEWLHAHRTEGCTSDAMDKAAANGHLRIVKWLHENRSEGCTTEAIDMAARRNHVEIVRFLSQCRPEGFTFSALEHAASDKIVDILFGVLRPAQRSIFLEKATHSQNEFLINYVAEQT